MTKGKYIYTPKPKRSLLDFAEYGRSVFQKTILRRINEKEQLKKAVKLEPIQQIWTDLATFEHQSTPKTITLKLDIVKWDYEVISKRFGGVFANLDITCSICFQSLEDDKNLGSLRCQHDYHYQCIMTWLKIKRRCPICRQSACKRVTI